MNAKQNEAQRLSSPAFWSGDSEARQILLEVMPAHEFMGWLASGLDETHFIIPASAEQTACRYGSPLRPRSPYNRRDILRARASADALRAVFGEEAMAVAAGHGIDAANAAQAEAAGIGYLEVPKPRRETGADLAEDVA